MSLITRAQRDALTALGNVGARNPKPERCVWCREFRGLRWCWHCKQWFCWRHVERDDHACRPMR